MTEDMKNTYSPDSVSPPGETLLEVLAHRGMAQAELATRTGRPKKTINEIIKGKAALTPETALQFELVLGIPAAFWNARESQYRESLARKRGHAEIEAQKELLHQVPYAHLARLGWVPRHRGKGAQVEELLRFFGVASMDSFADLWKQPQAAFRQSQHLRSHVGAVAAWLRKGELEAQRIDPEEYSEAHFRAALTSLRDLTRNLRPGIGATITNLCARAGVVLVYVPEVPGARAWGATRWLSPTRPLIQVSLRYRTDDHFWFTVFHEAAHILLHGKRSIFIEEDDNHTDEKEQEADAFASDHLIPRLAYTNFTRRNDFGSTAIRRFAHSVSIAPGIVVGRLQHEKRLRQDNGNELKQKLQWD